MALELAATRPRVAGVGKAQVARGRRAACALQVGGQERQRLVVTPKGRRLTAGLRLRRRLIDELAKHRQLTAGGLTDRAGPQRTLAQALPEGRGLAVAGDDVPLLDQTRQDLELHTPLPRPITGGPGQARWTDQTEGLHHGQCAQVVRGELEIRGYLWLRIWG